MVANVGILLPAVLAGRLWIEALIEETVELGQRTGAAHPGRTVMNLISAMCLVVDVDGFVGEVYGDKKQGHRLRLHLTLGYYPIIATRVGIGEVLHICEAVGESRRVRSARAGI